MSGHVAGGQAAVVFMSSEMREALGISDRILVMKDRETADGLDPGWIDEEEEAIPVVTGWKQNRIGRRLSSWGCGGWKSII